MKIKIENQARRGRNHGGSEAVSKEGREEVAVVSKALLDRRSYIGSGGADGINNSSHLDRNVQRLFAEMVLVRRRRA